MGSGAGGGRELSPKEVQRESPELPGHRTRPGDLLCFGTFTHMLLKRGLAFVRARMFCLRRQMGCYSEQAQIALSTATQQVPHLF